MNPFNKSKEELASRAAQVRRDILRMVHAVNSGHPGGYLGCTEFFVDLRVKWEAFGWKVLTYPDGNDFNELFPVLEEAKSLTGKGQPSIILMNTQMGFEVDFMMGSHKWYGVAPNDAQLQEALLQLKEAQDDY